MPRFFAIWFAVRLPFFVNSMYTFVSFPVKPASWSFCVMSILVVIKDNNLSLNRFWEGRNYGTR